MLKTWNRFWADESGQGLVEYVLIVALVSIGVSGVLVLYRNRIGGALNTVATDLSNQPSSPYSTT